MTLTQETALLQAPQDPARLPLARALSFFLLALFLILTACKPGEESKEEEEQEQPPQAVPVEVAEAKRGKISQTLQTTATVKSRREITLRAEAAGVVENIQVEEGDTVSSKQKLARLRNPQVESSTSSIELDISKLRRELANNAPLLQKGYISRQSYEELEHQLSLAQGRLRGAREQTRDLHIAAPISGIVARRSIQPGQQVSPGEELFYLVDPNHLEVAIQIPERSLGLIREGGNAYILSEALQGARFDARIRLINPVVNPRTGTVKVTVDIPSATAQDTQKNAQKLRPGMFVTVHLITAEKDDSILVPKRAVVYEDDIAFVWTSEKVAEEHKARKKRIKLGFTQDERIEILEGLQEGERVVTLGQSGLKEDTLLKVIE